ncbi:MAG TPA: hypothetical protein VI953_01935 [Candidatus Paceibacterota bacterium]
MDVPDKILAITREMTVHRKIEEAAREIASLEGIKIDEARDRVAEVIQTLGCRELAPT